MPTKKTDLERAISHLFAQQSSAPSEESMARIFHPEKGTPDEGGGGLRADAHKIGMDMLDPWFEREMAKVLTFGAAKYERDNWRKGMLWHRGLGPLRRHLNAWQRGEMFDSESGCHHLAMVAINAMFLWVWEQGGVGVDDCVQERPAHWVGDEDYQEALKELQKKLAHTM